jgi:hypothetical protein
MEPVKALLPLVLCFVSALAQAQVGVEKVTRADNAATSAGAAARQPRAAEAQRKQAATLAIFLTDDLDYLRLPAYASRTPPQPVRFIRVGVEWSF